MRGGPAILAASAVLALVSGCGVAALGGKEDPSATLAEAVARLKATTFKFSYRDGGSMTMDGRYDPARRQGEYTSTQTWIESGMDDKYQNRFVTTSRLIPDSRYETGWFTVRLGQESPEPTGPSPWCRTAWTVDGNPYVEDSYDPAAIPQTLLAAVEVRQQGDGTIFSGRVDAAKVSSPRPLTGPEDRGAALPVKMVPFEAAVDREGRLIRYSVDLSELLGSLPIAHLYYEYSDFGVGVEVTAPPAADTRTC